MKSAIILTCEHGGNFVPRPLRPLFAGEETILETHRGWDPGALDLARHLARSLKLPLHETRVSRLVVEMNRSESSRKLFSRFTRGLSEEEKEALLDKFYRPFRAAVAADIATLVSKGSRVIHLSIHTCTPVLNGETRNMDFGLLYDPARKNERAFCERLRRELLNHDPELRVRKNYPYLGTSDGHTRELRKQFPDRKYAGIEIEANQKWWFEGGAAWRRVREALAAAVAGLSASSSSSSSSSTH